MIKKCQFYKFCQNEVQSDSQYSDTCWECVITKGWTYTDIKWKDKK